METVKPTFMQRLQYVQAELAGIVQCAEISILVNCDYYQPQVTLPNALYAITEAIDAWKDCQHDITALTEDRD